MTSTLSKDSVGSRGEGVSSFSGGGRVAGARQWEGEINRRLSRNAEVRQDSVDRNRQAVADSNSKAEGHEDTRVDNGEWSDSADAQRWCTTPLGTGRDCQASHKTNHRERDRRQLRQNTTFMNMPKIHKDEGQAQQQEDGQKNQ